MNFQINKIEKSHRSFDYCENIELLLDSFGIRHSNEIMKNEERRKFNPYRNFMRGRE